MVGTVAYLAGGPGRKVFQEMPASPADSSLLGSEVTCSPQGRGLGGQTWDLVFVLRPPVGPETDSSAEKRKENFYFARLRGN